MKKSFIYSSVFIFLVLIGVLFFVYSENHLQTEKKYSGNDVSFIYPNDIAVEETDEEVILSHTVPFVHQDPCDFQGDGEGLQEIRDFDVTLKVIENSFPEVIKQNEGESFELQVSPGFVDEYSLGDISGYKITKGVEGCGYFTYYIPLEESKTLIITRSFVPEFNPINTNFETYLTVFDVIIPTKEEEIFQSIVSSLKVNR